MKVGTGYRAARTHRPLEDGPPAAHVRLFPPAHGGKTATSRGSVSSPDGFFNGLLG